MPNVLDGRDGFCCLDSAPRRGWLVAITTITIMTVITMNGTIAIGMSTMMATMMDGDWD